MASMANMENIVDIGGEERRDGRLDAQFAGTGSVTAQWLYSGSPVAFVMCSFEFMYQATAAHTRTATRERERERESVCVCTDMFVSRLMQESWRPCAKLVAGGLVWPSKKKRAAKILEMACAFAACSCLSCLCKLRSLLTKYTEQGGHRV